MTKFRFSLAALLSVTLLVAVSICVLQPFAPNISFGEASRGSFTFNGEGFPSCDIEIRNNGTLPVWCVSHDLYPGPPRPMLWTADHGRQLLTFTPLRGSADAWVRIDGGKSVTAQTRPFQYPETSGIVASFSDWLGRTADYKHDAYHFPAP